MRPATLTQSILTALLLFAGVEARRNPHRTKFRASLAALSPDYTSPYDTLSPEAECTVPLPPKVKAPKTNYWDFLTRSEQSDVRKFLAKQKFPNTTIYFTPSLMTPNKTDVLRYLDHNGPAPARYAKVLLSENDYSGRNLSKDTGTPTYSYLLVGPLPVSNATTWQRLTYPFTSPGGKIRDLLGHLDYRKYDKFNKNITDSIKDVIHDMWGNKTRWSAYCGQDPYWQYDNKVTQWSQFWGYSTGQFDSGDLLPLGLYYKATYDIFGADPSSWTFGGWLYNDIYYKTSEEFRKAYFSPGFEKLPPNLDGVWTHTDHKGPVFPLDKQAPPMPVAETARFSVDYSQKYVEWMGFSFYMTFLEESGMTLYDIRFKGERILYELGIQEALAHYAGNDPVQSGTSYLDGAYGLGDANELMPGYDCPTYASYLNITINDGYGSKDINAVCLFEFDADYSIQRHYDQSNTKNIYFVVRTITTVGNYDYSFSYEFYLDGSIQVVVRAAGYIQSAYYAKNHEYGYHIHDALSGSMHDHVLNYKADFDILGTANTMELVTFTPVTENYIWADQPRNTMKLVRSEIATEDESRLYWAQNGQTQYRIVNKDKPNKYGEYRGYRILPSQGTIHLAVNNSSNLVNAANWAYHDLQITQHHDTEPRSADPYNGNDVYEPLINFDDFFNGESLEQEDLVLWFNLGMHHLPHTGDLPNTVFTTAHSAIQITPSNYFAYDQSRDTINMVRLGYDRKTGESTVDTFGQAPQICMANLTDFGYY